MSCGYCGELGHYRPTCPRAYDSDEHSTSSDEHGSEEDGDIEVLMSALANVKVKNDIEKYNQLQNSHSKTITGFRSRSSCWDCFIEEHGLNRDIVKNLYTKNDVYAALNISLCRGSEDPFVKMYSQLLAEAIHNRYESLPDMVYRGTKFSDSLGRLYHRNIGETIYLYNFSSTSRSKAVAQSFAGPKGWLLSIRLRRGNRDCVADVSDISKYPHEKEVLISANAGFEILEVDKKRHTVLLELVDESKCLTDKPNKYCGAHAP